MKIRTNKEKKGLKTVRRNGREKMKKKETLNSGNKDVKEYSIKIRGLGDD